MRRRRRKKHCIIFIHFVFRSISLIDWARIHVATRTKVMIWINEGHYVHCEFGIYGFRQNSQQFQTFAMLRRQEKKKTATTTKNVCISVKRTTTKKKWRKLATNSTKLVATIEPKRESKTINVHDWLTDSPQRDEMPSTDYNMYNDFRIDEHPFILKHLSRNTHLNIVYSGPTNHYKIDPFLSTFQHQAFSLFFRFYHHFRFFSFFLADSFVLRCVSEPCLVYAHHKINVFNASITNGRMI